MRRAVPVFLVGVATLALLPVANPAARAQTGCPPEQFTAAAINTGHTVLLASRVDIRVTRWSTEREKDGLARTLLDRGPEALLLALREAASVGEIRTPNTLPYDLRFAWQERGDDGGRRIILIADWPMTIWKTVPRRATTEDAFTVVEIRLNSDGEGEGKVAIETNITVNRTLDLIELYHYDAEPIRLADVRSVRPTT
jgi:hypothetical protein